MPGKHSEEALELNRLKKELQAKENEMFELKTSLAEILQQIRNLNESNNCSNESVIKRKISELCTDTIYDLLLRKKESTAQDSQSEAVNSTQNT